MKQDHSLIYGLRSVATLGLVTLGDACSTLQYWATFQQTTMLSPTCHIYQILCKTSKKFLHILCKLWCAYGKSLLQVFRLVSTCIMLNYTCYKILIPKTTCIHIFSPSKTQRVCNNYWGGGDLGRVQGARSPSFVLVFTAVTENESIRSLDITHVYKKHWVWCAGLESPPEFRIMNHIL